MLYSRTYIPVLKQSKGYALSRNQNKENISNNMEGQGQKKVQKQIKKDVLPSVAQRLVHKKVEEEIPSSNWVTELKDTFGENVREHYGGQIFRCLMERCEIKGEFLGRHAISANLRAKMVDWMIQVLSSYKMSDESFFKSVELMNVYFAQTSRKLETSDLHLIGATCMFVAAKNEEIYPLKLSALYDKICRKKFAKDQILQMEEEILQTLEFNLQQTTLYDLVQLLKGEVSIPLKHQKYFNDVLLYLEKMVMHSYELAQYNTLELAVSIIFLGMKALQQIDSFDCNLIEEMRIKCRIEKDTFLSTSETVLSQAKNFKSLYPNLINLKRFHQINSSSQY